MTKVIKAMEISWTKEDPEDDVSTVDKIPKKSTRAAALKTAVHDVKVSKKKASALSTSKSAVASKLKSTKAHIKENNTGADKVANSVSLPKKDVTLKDLRPEDKKRVANLIQELARAGEERENVVEQMFYQRNEYDQYIRSLLDQQEMIVSEREKVMKHLYDCQLMLAKYQKILTKSAARHDKRKASQKKEESEFRFSPKPMGIAEYVSTFKSTESSPAAGQDREKPVEEVTPGGTRRRPRLPTEGVTRPFTTRIDHLLHEAASPSSSRTGPVSTISQVSVSPKSSRGESDSEQGQPGQSGDIAKGKLYGIGPLSAPVLSSTRTSDLLSNATNSPSRQPQGNTTQDFAPLSVETEVFPESGNKALDTNGGFCTPKKVNNSKYEKLMSEREALMKEQAQLREIINAQGKTREPLQTSAADDRDSVNRVTFDSPVFTDFPEKSDKELLQYYSQLSPNTRQKELNSQKEALLLEQERLKRILSEQETLLKAKQQQLHQQQELQQQRLQFFQETGYFPPLTDKASPFPVLANGEKPTAFSQPLLKDAFISDDHYHEKLPNPTTRDSGIQNAETTATTATTETQGTTESFLPCLDIQLVEEQILSESMESLRSLSRQGCDVPEIGIYAGKQKKENVHPAFSKKTKELIDRSHFMLQSRNEDFVRKDSKRQPLQSLADIIDEVEGLRNRGGGAAVNTQTAPNSQASSEPPASTADNAEESQLLDDVFFVRK